MSTKTLTLQSPITRGDKNIAEITLHQPNVAAMRGVSMRAVLDMQVDAIATVLPRISEPKMLEREVDNLALPDLLQAGILVASFFLPDSDQPEVA